MIDLHILAMSNRGNTRDQPLPGRGEGAAIKASVGQLLFRHVSEFKSAAQVAD